MTDRELFIFILTFAVASLAGYHLAQIKIYSNYAFNYRVEKYFKTKVKLKMATEKGLSIFSFDFLKLVDRPDGLCDVIDNEYRSKDHLVETIKKCVDVENIYIDGVKL